MPRHIDQEYDEARVKSCCVSEGCTRTPTKPFLSFNRTQGKSYWSYPSYCSICSNSKKNYGIDGPTRDNMLASQDGKCDICKAEVKFGTNKMHDAHVDHCHTTKKIRGILCGACNVSLGRFKDDITILESAIEYLKKHKQGESYE